MADNLRELMDCIIRKLGLMNTEFYYCDRELSVVQGYILQEISRLGEPSMHQVADKLCLGEVTFGRHVKSLIEKGLVRKDVLREDRRVNILSLTAAGKQAESQIAAHTNECIGRIFSQFTEFEKDTVIRSLRLLDRAISVPCCQKRE